MEAVVVAAMGAMGAPGALTIARHVQFQTDLKFFYPGRHGFFLEGNNQHRSPFPEMEQKSMMNHIFCFSFNSQLF